MKIPPASLGSLSVTRVPVYHRNHSHLHKRCTSSLLTFSLLISEDFWGFLSFLGDPSVFIPSSEMCWKYCNHWEYQEKTEMLTNYRNRRINTSFLLWWGSGSPWSSCRQPCFQKPSQAKIRKPVRENGVLSWIFGMFSLEQNKESSPKTKKRILIDKSPIFVHSPCFSKENIPNSEKHPFSWTGLRVGHFLLRFARKCTQTSQGFCTILAETITKLFLGTVMFVIIFVSITKIIPPEHFLCNVAATGFSLFAREHAKEFAL